MTQEEAIEVAKKHINQETASQLFKAQRIDRDLAAASDPKRFQSMLGSIKEKNAHLGEELEKKFKELFGNSFENFKADTNPILHGWAVTFFGFQKSVTLVHVHDDGLVKVYPISSDGFLS
jgi:hypothetical protein